MTRAEERYLGKMSEEEANQKIEITKELMDNLYSDHLILQNLKSFGHTYKGYLQGVYTIDGMRGLEEALEIAKEIVEFMKEENINKLKVELLNNLNNK